MFTHRQICHFPLVFARNWIAQVYITSLFLKIEYVYCIMAQRSPFQDTNAFGRVSHNFKCQKLTNYQILHVEFQMFRFGCTVCDKDIWTMI